MIVLLPAWPRKKNISTSATAEIGCPGRAGWCLKYLNRSKIPRPPHFRVQKWIPYRKMTVTSYTAQERAGLNDGGAE